MILRRFWGDSQSIIQTSRLFWFSRESNWLSRRNLLAELKFLKVFVWSETIYDKTWPNYRQCSTLEGQPYGNTLTHCKIGVRLHTTSQNRYICWFLVLIRVPLALLSLVFGDNNGSQISILRFVVLLRRILTYESRYSIVDSC